jgi:superfamily II DNA or RNA helicase
MAIVISFENILSLFLPAFFMVLRDVFGKNSDAYALQGRRQRPNNRPPLILHNISLYPFQKRAVEEAVQRQKGIIRMPSGSGKSLVIAGVLVKLGLPAVVYIHRKDIFYQLHKRFEEWLQ